MPQDPAREWGARRVLGPLAYAALRGAISLAGADLRASRSGMMLTLNERNRPWWSHKATRPTTPNTCQIKCAEWCSS